MNINATLLGQMITFAIFVWFTMKFVWPMLESALEERKKKIADGLAAAEVGHKTLEKAENEARERLQKAKEHCEEIIFQTNKQAEKILEDAKKQSLQERNDIVASGHLQVEQAGKLARSELQSVVAGLVVDGAEKILSRSINVEDHSQLLDKVVKGLG